MSDLSRCVINTQMEQSFLSACSSSSSCPFFLSSSISFSSSFFFFFYFAQKSTGKLGTQNNSDPIKECHFKSVSIVRTYIQLVVMSHHASFLPFLLLLTSPSSYGFSFPFFYVFPSPSYSFATALRCNSYRDYSKEK